MYFSLDAQKQLHESLQCRGFTGSSDELIKLLVIAKRKTDFEDVDYFLGKVQRYDTCNHDNVAYIQQLIDKLSAKYGGTAQSSMHRATIHYYGSRHPSKNYRYAISLYLQDSTSYGSGGYWGGVHVRILYGYDDHRREKVIVLADKQSIKNS